jgi:sodium-dependent dicarboxylate transporter 2/3/5
VTSISRRDSLARADGAKRSPLSRRTVGLALGPLLFAVVLALPASSLSPPAHRLAAIFVWVVVYWVAEVLPVAVTAVMASVLCVLLGIAPASRVFGAYGDPIIFLFIGSFILAEAMRETGLDRRFAFALLRHPAATRTPGLLMATIGFVTWVISLWVSNTATTAIMLPVGLGILRSLGKIGDPAQGRYPIGLMLMLTWASSVAVGIPIASPPNLIAIGMIRELAGRRLTFFDWVAVTMPLAIVMLILCWIILRYRYASGTESNGDVGAYVATERARLGAWSRAEVNVAATFALAGFLWMFPGAVAMVTSPDAPIPRFFEAHIPESVVALIAAILLFVLPAQSGARGTITWKQAANIDWGTVLLFGGGLSLGRLMFDTKLAEVMGRAVVDVAGADSLWTLTAVAIVLGIVLSETSSNTASASMIIPMIIAVAASTGISPIPPVIGAALGASFGFMLPVSTPPNAIVYGSGLVPLREMITSGIWLDVAGAVIIWIGLRILCPLFGVI